VKGNPSVKDGNRVGYRWLTKKVWIDEFFDRLGNLPQDAPARTPTTRAKATDAAAAKLQALGA
jgi:hypothetical protein